MCGAASVNKGRCRDHQRKIIKPEVKKESDKLYSTKDWKQTRIKVLYRDPLCVVCLSQKIYTEAAHVDHIIRATHCGNPFDLSNLMGICQSCHSSKTIYEQQFYDGNSYLGNGRNKYESFIQKPS